jgi:outer membrane receptor protein involved in Fe transport
VGFVPAGGTGRQRQNVERITSEGLELGATWRLDDRIHLRADYLYSDARDETTGRWLPQVSRHTVTLGGDWIPHKRWRVSGLLRHVSNAYEDDQNTLVLTAATTLDLRVAYTWAEGRTWFVAVENVTDEAVVTGRSADGLIDLGTPRLARTGITWRW